MKHSKERCEATLRKERAMHSCESCNSNRVTLRDHGTHFTVRCNDCKKVGKKFDAPMPAQLPKDSVPHSVPCPICGVAVRWANDIPLRWFCWGTNEKPHEEVSRICATESQWEIRDASGYINYKDGGKT